MTFQGSHGNRWMIASVVAALGSSSAGCFAIADLGRFHGDTIDGGAPGTGGGTGSTGTGGNRDSGNALEYQTLNFHMSGMKPHETSFFEYRVIDSNNFIQSHGILDTWVGDETTLIASKAIPPLNGPYRLDFYFDMNMTRSYDGIGDPVKQDHAWRVDPLVDYPAGQVSHLEGAINVDYAHNLSFTEINQFHGATNPPIDTHTDASIDFTGLTGHAGKMLEVRVTESGSGHVVGLYRLPKLPAEDFPIKIPGVIDAGVVYNVDVYIDANGNGSYENPAGAGGDLGWRLLQRGSNAMDGLKVHFDPAAETNSTVDVGPP